MTPAEEQNLASLAARGDRAAFTTIVRRFNRLVYLLIFKLAGNAEDAEDLTQEVFLKIYDSIGNFKGKSRLSTWIYRIACNEALSHLRKRGPKRLFEEPEIFETTQETWIDESGKEEQIERLEAALQRLSPEEYLLVSLFYLQECSVRDVASATGYSEGNVKTRLHRIRRKLYHLITVEFENR